MKFESEFAESIFKSKYLLENESLSEDAQERILKEFGRVFPSMVDELRTYISKQWLVLAGGIWRAAGNPNKNVSHINCTTLTPTEDSLESIFDSLYKWAKYAAFGQGEGIDISLLRPKGAKVHNSSRESTGAVSFMYLYDMVLKVIAQQGRRGASLISIKDTHPDLLEFIRVKDKPESDKSRIDTANISIQISDEFMQCVIEDKEWTLKFENKYEIIENKVRAKDIFEEICRMAHKRGDPGLQFFDKIKRESNSESFGYNVVSTNACSEQALDAENVCNLIHENLSKYYEYGDTLRPKIIRAAIFFGVSVIKNELADNRSPTELQRNKLIQMPRVGLGITGLADYFIDQKIVYGSEKSIEHTSKLFKDLAKYSYKANCELGKLLGSFPSYSKQLMKKSAYIQRLLNENIIEDSDLDYQYCISTTSVAPVGCLVKSSLIQTENSIKSIDQIFSEQGYILNELKDKENIWLIPKQTMYVKTMGGFKRIIKLYVNGFRKTLSLFNNDKKLIEGTENHMILVKKSSGVAIWKRLDEIKENDIIIQKKT